MIIWPLLTSTFDRIICVGYENFRCQIHSYSRTICNFRYQLSKLDPINQSLSNSEQSNVHLAITERKIQDLYVYELIKLKDLGFSLKIFSLFQSNRQPLPLIRVITLILQRVLEPHRLHTSLRLARSTHMHLWVDSQSIISSNNFQ